MAPSKRKQQPSEPSEGDLVAARAAVHLASLQRKVASWLPPKTEEQMAREKERDDDSDEEEFEVGYETLGVGATPPPKSANGTALPKRKDPSLEALRKQLLGRNAGKAASISKTPTTSSTTTTPRTGNLPHRQKALKQNAISGDTDDSEDEGRGAMFASKRAKLPKATAADDDEGAVTANLGTERTSTAGSKRKKASFMDEILAEKGAKKKKKKKGKGGGENAA